MNFFLLLDQISYTHRVKPYKCAPQMIFILKEKEVGRRKRLKKHNLTITSAIMHFSLKPSKILHVPLKSLQTIV
jgi:hypothetical protein